MYAVERKVRTDEALEIFIFVGWMYAAERKVRTDEALEILIFVGWMYAAGHKVRPYGQMRHLRFLFS
jgi:hypothetical protein